MDKYVDGFLLPVPKDKIEQYREMATEAGEVWIEHGALEFRECIGEDLDIEGMLSFRKKADASEGDAVLFSYIVYESREHRDKVNAAVMEDPRIKDSMEKDVPFDFKKMAYGGFETLVGLEK